MTLNDKIMTEEDFTNTLLAEVTILVYEIYAKDLSISWQIVGLSTQKQRQIEPEKQHWYQYEYRDGDDYQCLFLNTVQH